MSWRAGWGIIKDHPIFGVGPRNSRFIIYSYGADEEDRTIHNLYIQVAADTGIPSLLALLAMLFIAMRGLWRTSRSIRGRLDDTNLRWHYAVCQACFWSLFLYCFASVFLSTELFELSYLLMVMGAAAKGALETHPAPSKRSSGKAAALGSPSLERAL
jgi:O-antigen ligase